MRELTVTEFITVDGIAEHERLPNVVWNDAMNRFKEDELADSGAMLLGRVTYEIFAAIGPRRPATSPTASTRCRNMLHRPASRRSIGNRPSSSKAPCPRPSPG